MITPGEFYSSAYTQVSDELTSRLDVSSDNLVVDVLANRFLDCLRLCEQPTKYPLFRLRFGEDLEAGLFSMSGQDPHLAARSCEFYGGFFSEHIESLVKRKRSSLDRAHYETVLGLAYASLARNLPAYHVASQAPNKVLDSFQCVVSSWRWDQDSDGAHLSLCNMH